MNKIEEKRKIDYYFKYGTTLEKEPTKKAIKKLLNSNIFKIKLDDYNQKIVDVKDCYGNYKCVLLLRDDFKELETFAVDFGDYKIQIKHNQYYIYEVEKFKNGSLKLISHCSRQSIDADQIINVKINKDFETLKQSPKFNYYVQDFLKIIQKDYEREQDY